MSRRVQIQKILSKGLDLKDYGINNFGLCRKKALLALDELKNHKIAILGGDVCFKVNHKIELSYDNWHIEKDESETYDEFYKRSVEISRAYIQNYKNTSKHCEILFVLVAD